MSYGITKYFIIEEVLNLLAIGIWPNVIIKLHKDMV